jgi:hypothetical protein
MVASPCFHSTQQAAVPSDRLATSRPTVSMAVWCQQRLGRW